MDKKNFFKIFDAGGDLTKRWYVYFKRNGKRVVKYGNINKHKTIHERRKACNELIKQLTNTTPPTPEAIWRAVDAYLISRASFLRPKTLQNLQSKIRVLRCWLGHRSLTPPTLTDFFAHLLTRVGLITYNDYVEKLSKIFKAIGIELPPLEKARKAVSIPAQYFSRVEMDFLLPHLQKHKDLYLFVSCIYYCFIRPTELRKLRIGDILLEENKIRVRPDVSKNQKLQYVQIPLPFRAQLAGALAGRNPSEYLFGNNKQIGANTMARKHQKILIELGFDTTRFKLYSWKHTGAVMCVKAGVHIKELQLQLRHHSLEQVDAYLRQMGVSDVVELANKFPPLQKMPTTLTT